MRLIALHVYKWNETEAVLLAAAYELNMLWFYQRSVARDHVLHNSRLVATRMKPGQRGCIDLEEGKAKCYALCTPDKLCVTAVTDTEYPERAAFGVLYELSLDFIKTFKGNPAVISPKDDLKLEYKKIEEFLAKWQKPEENDKLIVIEKELQSVTEMMRKNLEDMLKKGEKLDELMEKSKDLNGISISFYKKAKKNNQCCSLY
eukprot:TRINITY_DN175_c0_g1_i5.p2 TRINITY_DN175_c0_g1~~TRINITY_DN175_c0_g1_i5.p2  ORF type:complete len:203 (-),score=70.98 TRINITY_DN175_c0_g1_i5:80-688(-)